MTHEGLWATSAECIAKAGVNYDSTNVDEAMINEFCKQAESLINCLTRYNWSSAFTGAGTTEVLTADVWHVLGEAESNLVGMYMITANMAGSSTGEYPSRIIVEDMINILRDRLLFTLAVLRDKKTQKFITEAEI